MRQVDFIVFCSGLIFPLTICIALTLQRKDQAVSYLSLIKTEIRALRIMFSCFNPPEEGKISLADEAEPTLRNLAMYVMCMCRNDQENQIPKSIWHEPQSGSNVAAHYIADSIANISSLLGRAERQHRVYDQFKDGWAVNDLFPAHRTPAHAKNMSNDRIASFCADGARFIARRGTDLVPYYSSAALAARLRLLQLPTVAKQQHRACSLGVAAAIEAPAEATRRG